MIMRFSSTILLLIAALDDSGGTLAAVSFCWGLVCFSFLDALSC
jgi:hypothetical protein